MEVCRKLDNIKLENRTYTEVSNYNYFKINVSSLHMPSCEVPFNQFFVLFPYGLPFLYSPE